MARAEETRGGEQRCGEEMGEWPERRACGRAIYAAQEHDKTPVCLMHSQDPGKDTAAFELEFERILAEAEENAAVANFQHFVFPFSGFDEKEFRPVCSFVAATFTQVAGFSSATFTQVAGFSSATFRQRANFSSARFAQDADFSSATFTQNAYFSTATFAHNAYFRDATFVQAAYFSRVIFTQATHFSRATFAQSAYFNEAMFSQSADFSWVTCMQDAHFSDARFTQSAYFSDVRFMQAADFSVATFTQNADLANATFAKGIYLSRAIFLESAVFRKTAFRRDLSRSVGLDFSNVTLAHPEKVEFYDVDLGQAVFFNTDVSKVDFTLVRWRERGRIARYLQRKKWLRWRLRLRLEPRPTWARRKELLHDCRRRTASRFCLFEEEAAFERFEFFERRDPLSAPEGSTDERNYALIAETYQQLKRNYDAKGDYWTAGHFHYGEMEMLRLHSERKWAPLRWLERNLGLTALYKYASAYGESVTLPLAWLALFVLVVFPLLYPATGLEVNPRAHEQGLANCQVNYRTAPQFFHDNLGENHLPEWMRWATAHNAAAPLLMHSVMASISVAGFQKELRYAPSYPWGRALALLELLLTTTVGGLFLLAVRRQYKRS